METTPTTGMDAGTIVSNVVATLTTELGEIAPVALVLGGSVLAVTVGYRFIKKFVS